MEHIANRNELARLFTGTGAEIGVYRGEFSAVISQYATKLYCIDSYRGYKSHSQADLDDAFAIATRRLPDAEFIIRSSMDAVHKFQKDSLDFVYIDGNHYWMHISEDIYHWARKVKPGGIVAGHDYFLSKVTHVKPVVDSYAQAYGKTICVTDEEQFPSWWFVK
jgi:predicted O-methyltransferase YrrM